MTLPDPQSDDQTDPRPDLWPDLWPDPRTAPFWSPAFPKTQLWRTLLGFVLINAVFLAATAALFVAGAWLLDLQPRDVLHADTPGKVAIFFLTFLGYHLGLFLVLRFLHKRSFRSLFGPENTLRKRQFLQGLAVAIAVSLTALVVESALMGALGAGAASPPAEVSQNMPLQSWLLILIPALVLILIQILAEELVFRGYVLQQLRARFRSVWIWAILPSLCFGALHFDPATYGINAYFYVTHTTVVGIVLALVTLHTGNIGAAAGLHFGNNAMLILVGTKGNLDGFSLFLAEVELTGPDMTLSILLQTSLIIGAFVLWRLTIGRTAPIANTVGAD